MSRTARLLASFALAAASFVFAESAARAGDSAQDFIQSRQSQVTAIVKQPSNAQRDKQISGVLDGMLDYAEVAKRSLAAHWADLSDAQKKEFTDILKRLVQKNYERNIKNIADYRVEYLGEEPAASGIVVHTRATSTVNDREDPVTIDYQLQSGGGAWKVVDIVTDGSSLVNNYRSQFHRIIQKDGYDALVKRMRDKLAKGQTV